MGCAFRIRLNHLGSIWYTVLSVLVQLYLLYLGLNRYRLYTEMKWPHGAYPQVWLTVYVSVLTVCIPLLVLFAAFGILKSGNLAGDNDQIGGRTERIIELTPRKRNARRRSCLFCACHSLKSCWQHSPPFPQTIHLALAICQLFAQQIMLAQLYRYGFINSGDFLNTELDFAYQRSRQLVTNLPMGDTRLQGFRITSDELAESPMAPNLLPILMHARLFGIPLEFLNFIVALIAYSYAYPSVFWRLSKAFSLCFSFHLLIHSATLVYTYMAFSVLFRVQETNFYSVRPVGIGQYLWALRPLRVYHPLAVIGTFVITVVLMQFSPMVLYAYGYNKYLANLLKYRHSVVARRQIAAQNASPQTQTAANNGGRIAENSITSGGGTASSCCDGYGPHISAILILMFIVAAKAPTLYALTLLYQQEEKPLILSCIGVDVVYLFTWIFLWLALTLKRDWRFHVVHDVREILSLQDALHTADGHFQGQSISELKNALLLMHKGHLFVTDDPLAKPSIMRHVLKTGVQDDIYWLRTNQSPANRRIPMEDCNGNMLLGRGHKTPEMSRLLDDSTGRMAGSTVATVDFCDNLPRHVDTVPLAAPPYHHRMTSLPQASTNFPLQQIRPIMGSSMAVNNTFSTLQRSSEYGGVGAFVNSSPSCQHRQIVGQITGFPTIQRSSIRNGGGREYGIVGGSPQLFRQNSYGSAHNANFAHSTNTIGRNRGGTTIGNGGGREVIIGGPPMQNASLTNTTIAKAADEVYGNIGDEKLGNYMSYGSGTKSANNNLSTAGGSSLVSEPTKNNNGTTTNGNIRRNSSQLTNGYGTPYDSGTMKGSDAYDRRPTFHSVDLRNREGQPTAQTISNYNGNKFVSFNENTVKPYGEIGSGGTLQRHSTASNSTAKRTVQNPTAWNISQTKKINGIQMEESSSFASSATITPPSPSTVIGGGTATISRDGSATSGSNATVSTLSAKSSTNGSYFYGGDKTLDATTPTQPDADGSKTIEFSAKKPPNNSTDATYSSSAQGACRPSGNLEGMTKASNTYKFPTNNIAYPQMNGAHNSVGSIVNGEWQRSQAVLSNGGSQRINATVENAYATSVV